LILEESEGIYKINIFHNLKYIECFLEGPEEKNLSVILKNELKVISF